MDEEVLSLLLFTATKPDSKVLSCGNEEPAAQRASLCTHKARTEERLPAQCSSTLPMVVPVKHTL